FLSTNWIAPSACSFGAYSNGTRSGDHRMAERSDSQTFGSFDEDAEAAVDAQNPAVLAVEKEDVVLTEQSGESLQQLMRQARLVSYISIAVTLVSGFTGLVSAIVIGSAATLGYALESFVDVFSSAIVLWRFWEDSPSESVAFQRSMASREKRASVAIAITFVAIGLIVAPVALGHLVEAHHMEDVGVILVSSVINLFILSALAIIKLKLAVKLKSPALRKDGITSAAVAVLCLGIIMSIGIYHINQAIWWLDAIVAITVAGMLIFLGIRTLLKNDWMSREFWWGGSNY
ncbi:hypothetical protein CYMTET_28028, partial [Cymbomonas tetramitiformis]